MDTALFTNPAGRLVEVERDPPIPSYTAFVPGSLPPGSEDGAIAAVARELGEANLALGQLTGIGEFFPNPDLLVRPYLRREAVASSRIEGTVASFSDVVALEAGIRPVPGSDTQDVLNYVVALDAGLRASQEGLFSLDLVRSLHRQLMTGARGEALSNPGEFRAIQNHIGSSNEIVEATYVPPPPLEMYGVLDQLIDYLNESKPRTPFVVEAAWMHYQFEAAHPFLDGNGRVGRLLIALLLAARHRVSHPLLYLSPYFERQRDEYYRLLLAVSSTSAWEAWLRFFLVGVADQAREAISVARSVLALRDEWRERLALVGATPSALRLADFVTEHVAVTPRVVELGLSVARQTAYNSLQVLVDAGILESVPLRQRGSLYIAPQLIKILEV
ncbi:MAG: Fic family protein [Chloroflexota bacterium]|nr:Fic family protein [Chloroflexota bacterium]